MAGSSQAAPPTALTRERLRAAIGEAFDWKAVERAQFRGRELMKGHALWHVSDRSRSGGLAELLRSQVAYARGAGIDARWEVLELSPALLTLARRIHNGLHGQPDAGVLAEGSRST
jgi:trehalose synthase